MLICFSSLIKWFHIWETTLRGKIFFKAKIKIKSLHIHSPRHTEPPVVLHCSDNKAQIPQQAVKIFTMQALNCGNKHCGSLLTPSSSQNYFLLGSLSSLFRPHFSLLTQFSLAGRVNCNHTTTCPPLHFQYTYINITHMTEVLQDTEQLLFISLSLKVPCIH